MFIYLHTNYTYIDIYLSIYLLIFLSIYLSTYLSIHLSIYPSIHLFAYLSIYLPHLSNRLALAWAATLGCACIFLPLNTSIHTHLSIYEYLIIYLSLGRSDLCPLVGKVLDRGDRCADARVVCDGLAVQRHVQVAAHQHPKSGFHVVGGRGV